MEKVAGLEVIQKLNPNSKKHFVILHGYGANAQDLFSLQKLFDNKGEHNWHFPNGFINLALSPMFDSRAWFPIDIESYEKAQREGRHRDLASVRPAGLNEARDRLLKFIKEIINNGDELVLGGFSQGAMLSAELSFHLKPILKAVILLSGAILDEISWFPKFAELKGLKFIQTHGEQDMVLSFTEAQRLSEKLQELGWEGSFHPFQGGHEIPMHIALEVRNFIESL